MKRLTKKYTIGMINSKEALKQIKNHLYAILKLEAPELIHHYDNKFAIVEKDLEVLEILKEKKVDVGYLLNEECESYGDYNSYQSCRQERILTEDEFSKVKEWLER